MTPYASAAARCASTSSLAIFCEDRRKSAPRSRGSNGKLFAVPAPRRVKLTKTSAFGSATYASIVSVLRSATMGLACTSVPKCALSHSTVGAKARYPPNLVAGECGTPVARSYQSSLRSSATYGALVTPKVAARRLCRSASTVPKTSFYEEDPGSSRGSSSSRCFLCSSDSSSSLSGVRRSSVAFASANAAATRANSGTYPVHSAHHSTVKATTTVWLTRAPKRVDGSNVTSDPSVGARNCAVVNSSVESSDVVVGGGGRDEDERRDEERDEEERPP